jgi:hypothetical protein
MTEEEKQDNDILMKQLKRIMRELKYHDNPIPRNALMQQVADIINYKYENGKNQRR